MQKGRVAILIYNKIDFGVVKLLELKKKITS